MSAPEPPPLAADWSPTRKLRFRFVFAYFVLYFFPFPEGSVPGTLWLSDAYVNFWYRVDQWVGHRVLGIAGDISIADTGSGDRACDYIHLTCNFVLAVLITALWSALDRRRREYTTLSEWLRIYLRYVLACVLLLYGVIKLLGGQFFPPSALRLNETFGQSSPQVLLWTFMGASAPYTFFVGAAETLGGLLLYSRRTTTVGAILSSIVLVNVVMMNFCYAVPVKQFSSHLLLATTFVLWSDLRRLCDFFFLHRASLLPQTKLHFSSSRVRRAMLALKVVAIGAAVYHSVTLGWTGVHRYGPLAAKHPLSGHYVVEEFSMTGDDHEATCRDDKRWRTITVAERGFVVLRTMNEAHRNFMLGEDVTGGQFTLTSNGNARQKLAYSRPDPDHLVVEGTFDDRAVVAKLKRVDPSSYPLVSHGFHWIQEW